MTSIYVTKDSDKRKLLEVLKSTDTPYRVKVSKGGTRSIEQNAYLWGVCYETILDGAGLRDQGWRNEDIHEYLLGEHFGWEILEGLNRKRAKPLHRSSTLSKTEFSDYVAFIQEWAANHGVYIPDPGEA